MDIERDHTWSQGLTYAVSKSLATDLIGEQGIETLYFKVFC